MPLRTVASAVAALAMVTALLVLPQPPPASAATCTVPRNQTVRSLSIDFDQCYAEDITAGGVALEVHVFYLETDSTANTDRCLQGSDEDGNRDEPADSDADGVPDRCEHKIAPADDANGDNLLATSIAAETEMALDFYADLGLDAMGGETVMEIFISEDPGNGGVPSGTRMNLDDEGVDRNDLIYGRAVTFHEMQHLVQRFLGYTGATAFFSEGVARATQDRYDPATDMIDSWGFLSDANRLLENVVHETSPDGYRHNSIENVSYRGMSWWTWFMDTYTTAAESAPVTGWEALADFYDELVAESDQFLALEDVIADRGSTFTADFIDYTLALWAHDHSPTDPRLTFDDTEYVIDTDAFADHSVATGAPAVAADTTTVNARSSRYYEIVPNGSCDYATYTFDSPDGAQLGFSAISVTGGVADQRWTSVDSRWARAMPTDGADRVVGVVTGLEETADVDVDWGCAQPEVDVTLPTTQALAYAGLASDPRRFIVRTEVTAGGAPIAGLLPDDFAVRLNLAGGGPDLPATVVSGAYTGDDWDWLLVQAPDDADGAQTASLYDVTVDLGTASGSSAASVAYLERTLDRLVVLDTSGSMDDVAGKLEAAQNAAMLMTLELATGDQGGLITFADTAGVDVGLDEIDAGHRAALEAAIAGQTAAGGTSIGAGMVVASEELAAQGVDDHVCTYTVLSDGEENVDPLVADVEDDIADDGCPIDAVAFGPEADEDLMQDLADLVPGGTYDYAPVSGQVPLAPPTTLPDDEEVGGGAVGWENHLARVYDQALTTLAGRQRLLSAAGTGFGSCGDPLVTVDFADQVVVGTEYAFGDSFTTGGVAVTTGPFAGGGTSEQGSLVITDDTQPGAAPPQLLSESLNAVVDFGQPLCGAQLRYLDAGSQTQLLINGDRRIVEGVSDLDGLVVGGVTVDVQPSAAAADRGLLVLTGELSELSFGGQELAMDDLTGFGPDGGLPILVDGSSDLLLVAGSWQLPLDGTATRLIDPEGTPAPTAQRRTSTEGTAEVWEVEDPAPGIWRLQVDDIGQEVVVNASARTDLALQLLPFPADLTAGDEVPVLTSFVGPDGPIVGADVEATVQGPDGATSSLILHDDGDHGDGLADDGIYGNRYQTGPQGDTLAQQGSHLVAAVGSSDGHRREAQGAFAVSPGEDLDGDGLLDGWETGHGLDPTVPDPDGDPDRDGLTNTCEQTARTHPSTSDTDHGGTRDDAEVDAATCQPRPDRNPRDPADDPVDTVTFGVLTAGTGPDGLPTLVVEWGRTGRGDLDHVELHCSVDGGPWDRVGPDLTDGRHVIEGVGVGELWRCEIRPFATSSDGEVVPGRIVPSGTAGVLPDPHAPVGSVVIDGGAVATADRVVDLSIEANDHLSGDDHEEAGRGTVPGDAPADLEMRIANAGDLSDAPWQPFSATVADWDLGPVPAGSVATVHVELRDTAGNTSGGGEGDTILVVGGERLEGPSRVETAVDISQSDFPAGGAGAVVLARADEFPDAIAGTPLAVQEGAPILLTQPDSLHPATAAEITRVLPAGRTVHLLGGTDALSADVQDAVAALGHPVVRLEGPTRFETAVAVADALEGQRIAFIATHDDFAAALAAGPAAGVHDGVILLSAADEPHPASQAWLADHPATRVVAIGQPAVAAHPDAEAVEGATREATSVAVAEAFFAQPGAVGLARSSVFADALTGGPHMSRLQGPLLLTPDGSLDPDVATWVCGEPTVAGWFAYGGDQAIAPAVVDALAARIAGEGCTG